ncbi:MAG: serine/threonine-protein kinase [Proteobacteria bacterium]|nr:serine/threonine-protein kinase [Pseudomonadota bacterium]
MGAVANKNIANSSLPKQIGRFEPLDILGKGAQGTVYLAEDTQLGRKVAIKTLDKHRQNAEQLNQEAKNVSQLSHPHIIPLYEIGFHEDTPFLVYRFYEGEQLKQRLQREGKLKQLDAVNITNQLLEGIAYAHNNNIIHRDLNPSNLLIDTEGNTKLLESSVKEAEEFTRILNIDTSKVTVFNSIRKNTEEKDDRWTTEVSDKKSSDDEGVTIETVKAEPKTQQQTQHDILVNGIAEITDSLLGDCNINDILTMVLETLYRGMGFN